MLDARTSYNTRCQRAVAAVLSTGLMLGLSVVQAGEAQPRSPRGLEWEAHRNATVVPAWRAPSSASVMPLRPDSRSTSLTATVFGFLPYWSSAAFLRHDLLTHIACAAVEVSGDGTLGNDHGWPWTSVINEAHQDGVRVVLVATLFDSAGLLDLLTDPEHQSAFFANIHGKMLEGSADGLNIDFEGDGTQWQAFMPSFMAELTSYLHAAQPGCDVTVDGPAVNWSGAWDLSALAQSCDGIVIMGYDFYGSWSTSTGPVAPLAGGSFNIENTVYGQYASVVKTSPDKLILGVPYYGAHWTTVSSEPRCAVTGWIGHPGYSTAQPESELYGLLWDEQSQTPWYRWHDGTTWHQVWFDNATSLGRKYDLAIAASLRGVGIWALGYDGDRTELWATIEDRFVHTPPPPIPVLSEIGLSALSAGVILAGAYTIRRRHRTCEA